MNEKKMFYDEGEENQSSDYEDEKREKNKKLFGTNLKKVENMECQELKNKI